MMKTIFTMACLATLCAAPGLAQTTSAPADSASAPDQDPVAAWNADRTVFVDAAGLDLDAFKWIARPVLVFADSPNDPQFVQQIELLEARAEELALRDVVVIFDTDPAARSETRLRLRPRGFMLALMGKDGVVKARKPRPWDVRELSRSIDKMPMRQQEMQDRRGVNQ
ncbi:DUF4174 domain-containing protein [Loktanella sp. R86503]|uniref:DUF4174 domain-containing protein n=1 Tax=Loktanella sp. R86503 TaxID=3093847 RepID=UPI0036DA5816